MLRKNLIYAGCRMAQGVPLRIMDALSSNYYDRCFENAFLKAKGDAFQTFFEELMSRAFKADFMPCRPWGKIRDRKNDGFLKSQRRLFQVYAPNDMTAAQANRKIAEDFAGALKHWGEHFDKWTFVHNAHAGLPPHVQELLLETERANPGVKIEPWSLTELRTILRTLDRADLESWFGPFVPGGDPPPPETDTQLLGVFAGYRNGVATDTKVANVVTDGLAVEESFTTKPLRLRKVYVALDTATTVRRPDGEKPVRGEEPMENRTLTAWQALMDSGERLSVFIGEPGSGKSTFIQFATLELAETQNAVVPFRILLRKFADFLAAENRTGCSEDVIAFLDRPLLADSQHAAAGHLRELLTRGLAAVFFDGLDEVPGPHVAAVRGAITGFALRGFPHCRVAATCRVASYEKPGSEFLLPGFPEPHKIRSLSPELRAGFIRAWYGELRDRGHITAAEADALATSLQNAIRASDDLREMAGNPFFLSAMSALHSRPGTKLPDSAAALMDLLVSGTLEQSRKTRDGGVPIAADVRALRHSLQRLAFKSRETRSDRKSTLLDLALLIAELAHVVGDDTNAAKLLIEELRHRAGILHSTDGKGFSFAYRFEEFLAGCHLTNREEDWPRDRRNFDDRALALWRAQGDYARKVIVWAAGVCAHVERSGRGDVCILITALLDAAKGHADADLAALDLAADIGRDARIAEWGASPSNAARALTELRTRLEAIRGGDFPPKVRSRAASALGRLGDLPDGAGCRDGVPWFAWSPEILAGPFVMGGTAGEEERPRTIAAPYRIAKFPVTVAQNTAFIAAGGYEKKSWWSPKGARWRAEKNITGPEDYDAIYQTPNHPRVGVSWFEAEAFCLWLNALPKAALGIAEGEQIRLATEAEWERAARGEKNGRPLRAWPWEAKDENFAERCNSEPAGIGNTSAVGLFSKGDTPEGIADMSGNV